MAETNQQNSEKDINTTTGTTKQTGGRGKIKPRWRAGESGNPSGRPKGSRNFSTIFDEAIRKIVEEKKINIDNPEREMVTKAVVEALKGNFNYYKDTMDRRYGKPVQPLSSDPENPLILQVINYDGKSNNNPLSIPAEGISVEVPTESSEIQSGGLAPESGQVKNGTESADNKNAD